MGNAISGTNADNNSIGFDKNELKILYKNFVKLDTDATGYLEPNEFFDIPELKDNPIVQRIIKVFDSNGDGKISFYEFVVGLSNLTSSGNIPYIYLIYYSMFLFTF
jgi:Ca2+-binding EF-hand superfamily protein